MFAELQKFACKEEFEQGLLAQRIAPKRLKPEWLEPKWLRKDVKSLLKPQNATSLF